MKINLRAYYFFFLFLINIILSVSNSFSQDTILFKHGLALPLPGGYADVVISPNPIESLLALDKWSAPIQGDVAVFPGNLSKKWQIINVDSNDWFSNNTILSKCYIYLSFEMKKRSIMLLQAMGNEMVYVNGSPRSGNPYCTKDSVEWWDTDFNYSFLPVLLEKGKNELLLRCQRDRLKVRLIKPKLPVMFNPKDMTTPDFISGEKIDTWGSIVIINSTEKSLNDLCIKASVKDNYEEISAIPEIQPLSIKKVSFKITSPSLSGQNTVNVKLTLFKKRSNGPEILDAIIIPFKVVDKYANHKETFMSKIDGSIQYYGISPSRENEKPCALFISLHGAGVEAINQLNAYFPKKWGHIVVPTNRRPYGFSWEEWGLEDALETMDIIKERYNIDENRIYLTGHSMGGHGVWHIGSLFPDRFSALGPSAGWINFWSYRFLGSIINDSSDIRKIIRRSTNPSETFFHIRNFKQLGIYILHGSEDDNVLPSESRSMVALLSEFHKDFIYYEQKGAGHWWDISDTPGADCLDWPPMYDFFGRHSRPGKDRIQEIDFTTFNPGVSSKNNWLTIDAQNKQLELSNADILFEPGSNRFSGTIKNISRLSIDLDILTPQLMPRVIINGEEVKNIQIKPGQKQLWIEQNNGKFLVSSEPSPNVKNHNRYGTFKDILKNKVIFVYGTKGTTEENKWAFERARYDAEKLWYQGNGSIDVISDNDFDPKKEPDRNVILYGNTNTNKIWKELLSNCPVKVLNGFIKFGDKKYSGSDLSCILIWPRDGSAIASVAAVSGTGITGLRSMNRLPYMNPGINLPDCTIFNSDVLVSGDAGVILSGFFGLDWSIEKGEFIYKEKL